jgi:c-di-GMP-binding flagellar brake protein YcgR
MSKSEDKRKFRRVNAPVYFSYAPLLSRPATPLDISPGGLRMYSEQKVKLGKRLELMITLSDGRIIECEGQVVWVKALPSGSPARYDIGVGFLRLSKENEKVLAEYLEAY